MQNRERLSIKLDSALVTELETYCEAYGVDRNEFIQAALNDSLQSKVAKIDQVIDGYAEMAQLNSQIAEEFSDCECEAYARIRAVDIS